MFFEEYESIKLLDYDNLTQEEAAVSMRVSRPTLTRIYESARNKVARSMVEGKDLVIRGGNFRFDENWYHCNSCHSRFNLFDQSKQECPVCRSLEIYSLNEYFSAEN